MKHEYWILYVISIVILAAGIACLWKYGWTLPFGLILVLWSQEIARNVKSKL